MGIIDPSCVAAGPENTVYAFALALTYGNSTMPPGSQHYVIAKSNANPTSSKEMTWSIVATISSSAFSMLDKVITCVISDQGVVTVFGDTKYDPRLGISDAYGYMVIRYDPSATPNGGMASTGPGGWMNITVSNTYTLGRNSTMKWSLAFYVKDTAAGGAQKLIHLTSAHVNFPPVLQFGIVDETTKTLSHAANWTLTLGPMFPNLRSLAFSNNELFIYWISGPSEAKMSVYPLTGLPLTIPANPRMVDMWDTYPTCSNSSHVFSGFWGPSYNMLCAFDVSAVYCSSTIGDLPTAMYLTHSHHVTSNPNL
ncbi:MAG: hypothetical protein J3Q66DRAFT_203245 [Benniella sp.]|nr:MAG: hypothetical protein J3Q66DRAFT_203245 [Benniella sp.]